jgi:hypothetical protein
MVGRFAVALKTGRSYFGNIAAMKLGIPLCWFNKHVPKRNRVKWDGISFIGHCRFCGAQVRRREKGGWVKDWVEPA